MTQFIGQGIREQRGVVLIVAMLVLAVLSVLGLAFLTTARTEDTIAANYRNHTAAFYAAEAGTESGVASLKALLRGNPTPTDVQLAGLVAPALTDPSYTFDAFQVQRVRTVPPYAYRTTLSGGAYSGLFAWTTDYVVTASVTGPRGSRARLTQKIQHVGIPLFQFMAFNGRGIPLQFFPGPKMTVNGRIHANSNIHLGTIEGLEFESYVTAAGNIYRHSVADPSYRGPGVVQIKDASGNLQTLNFDHEYDYNFANTWAESDWKAAALKTFGDRVQDGAMGVQEIIPPIPDALYDPNDAPTSSHVMIEKGDAADSPDLKAAKMYYKAGLIIENQKAYDQAGNSVDINKCKDAKGKQAVRKEKFYDADNKTDMEVTQIDVGALTACGVMPKNGIVYATAKEGSPNKGEGIRLVNGAQLPGPTAENPDGGLTVVSENPVYVMGDYNTKDKNGNPRTVSTPVADLVPAAVLGDAVTVLSNNWEKNGYDNKGKASYLARTAADTTINAAFASGQSMRLLEDWRYIGGQKTLTYNGSQVSLWNLKYSLPNICCPNYAPPIRKYAYDTHFDTIQPPGTPMGTIVTRGQWSQL
jgi:hypothetical protein